MAKYREGDVVYVKGRIEKSIAYGTPNDQASLIVILDGYDQARDIGVLPLDGVAVVHHDATIAVKDRVCWPTPNSSSGYEWGYVKAIESEMRDTYLWVKKDNGDMETVDRDLASRV